jgi:hypothetical protein
MEIAELAGMKKADIEKVKAFLSTSDDKYRPSYGKTVESHPVSALSSHRSMASVDISVILRVIAVFGCKAESERTEKDLALYQGRPRPNLGRG